MNGAALIVDGLGFQAFERRGNHLLFKVISKRCERVSTIITSGKSIRNQPVPIRKVRMETAWFSRRKRAVFR